MRLGGPQLDGRDGQHPGAAAEIDDTLTVGNMTVEPLEAERRGGMSSRSECQPGIHLNHDGVRCSDLLVMWADPQFPPEAHRVKISQPFALPNTILNAL